MVAMPTLGPFLGGANDLAKAAVQETAAQRTMAAHATKSQRFDLRINDLEMVDQTGIEPGPGIGITGATRQVARNRPAANQSTLRRLCGPNVCASPAALSLAPSQALLDCAPETTAPQVLRI